LHGPLLTVPVVLSYVPVQAGAGGTPPGQAHPDGLLPGLGHTHPCGPTYLYSMYTRNGGDTLAFVAKSVVAAAIAVTYSLLLTVFFYRTMTRINFLKSLARASKTAARRWLAERGVG